MWVRLFTPKNALGSFRVAQSKIKCLRNLTYITVSMYHPEHEGKTIRKPGLKWQHEYLLPLIYIAPTCYTYTVYHLKGFFL